MKESKKILIARNTLMLYIRMVLVMAINLFTSRIILQALGVTDYGIYNAIGGVVVFFSFLSGPLSSATRRFLNFELGVNNIEKAKIVFSTSVFIHILLAILVLVLAETVGVWLLLTQLNYPEERSIAAFWVFQFSLLTLIVKLFITPYNADIIANEKMEAFAYISIAEVFLNLSMTFVLLYVSFDRLILYSLFLFIIQCLILYVYFYYCRRHFSESLVTLRFEKDVFRKMLSFIGWTMTGGISTIFSNQGIMILLNVFFGPIVNAAMAVSSQVQSGVSVLCSNFQTAIAPQLTKLYAQENFAEMHQMLLLSSKFSFFLVLLMSIPIYLETDIILNTWLVEVPSHTVNFLRITLVTGLICSLANPLVLSIHATGNIRLFQIIVESVQLSYLLLSFLVLKLVSGIKPETVFIIALVVAVFAQYARIRIVLPAIRMRMSIYIYKVIFPIIEVLVISPIIPFLFFKYSGMVGVTRFIFVCLICTFNTSITSLYIGCTKHERTVIINLTKNLIMRFKK